MSIGIIAEEWHDLLKAAEEQQARTATGNVSLGNPNPDAVLHLTTTSNVDWMPHLAKEKPMTRLIRLLAYSTSTKELVVDKEVLTSLPPAKAWALVELGEYDPEKITLSEIVIAQFEDEDDE